MTVADDDVKMVVAGGTGLLGRLTAQALARRGGAQVFALSRSGQPAGDDVQGVRGDLLAGENLDAAVARADAVIWCAHDRAAHENDARGVRNLLAACARAGVRHFVYTGIAGIETALASPYYAGKLKEEGAILSSGVGHTIFRATQFHSLAISVIEACDDGKEYHVPRPLLLRPVAPESVAERLADLAFLPPGGRAPDLAGPHDVELVELARIFARVSGSAKPVVEAREVPARWQSLQTLTHGPAERAGPDFERWLRMRA